jgi:hypothetical protein
MLLAAPDQTIIATAIPTSGRETGDPEHLASIVTGHLLAATVVTRSTANSAQFMADGKCCKSPSRHLLSIACAMSASVSILAAARTRQAWRQLNSRAQTIVADTVAPREQAR